MSAMNQFAIDRVESDALLIRLAGQWELRSGIASASTLETELQREPRPSRIAFDAQELGRWDSSILVFLAGVSGACRGRGVLVDGAGLPAGLHSLLDLAEGVPEPTDARKEARKPGFVERIGDQAIHLIGAAEETLSF